jgi:beta-lactam-binding protein with PASTA domain
VRIHVDAPVGVVLAQAPPAAGSRAGRGAAVDVVVSLGPKPRAPSCPTWSASPSTTPSLATVAGLAPSQVVVERCPPTAPPDTVLAQSLAPYRDVVLRRVLRLIVADVPGRAATRRPPRPGGPERGEARALAAGFDVDVVYVG